MKSKRGTQKDPVDILDEWVKKTGGSWAMFDYEQGPTCQLFPDGTTTDGNDPEFTGKTAKAARKKAAAYIVDKDPAYSRWYVS